MAPMKGLKKVGLGSCLALDSCFYTTRPSKKYVMLSRTPHPGPLQDYHGTTVTLVLPDEAYCTSRNAERSGNQRFHVLEHQSKMWRSHTSMLGGYKTS